MISILKDEIKELKESKQYNSGLEEKIDLKIKKFLKLNKLIKIGVCVLTFLICVIIFLLASDTIGDVSKPILILNIAFLTVVVLWMPLIFVYIYIEKFLIVKIFKEDYEFINYFNGYKNYNKVYSVDDNYKLGSDLIKDIHLKEVWFEVWFNEYIDKYDGNLIKSMFNWINRKYKEGNIGELGKSRLESSNKLKSYSEFLEDDRKLKEEYDSYKLGLKERLNLKSINNSIDNVKKLDDLVNN